MNRSLLWLALSLVVPACSAETPAPGEVSQGLSIVSADTETGLHGSFGASNGTVLSFDASFDEDRPLGVVVTGNRQPVLDVTLNGTATTIEAAGIEVHEALDGDRASSQAIRAFADTTSAVALRELAAELEATFPDDDDPVRPSVVILDFATEVISLAADGKSLDDLEIPYACCCGCCGMSCWCKPKTGDCGALDY